MIVADANVLLYSVNTAVPQHPVARDWLTAALSRTEAVGLPWVSLLAFIRISTNPRAFPAALTADQAMDLVERWLASPSAVVVSPTPRHSAVLRGLVGKAGVAGNLTTDAHIAALALEHGAQVVTFDRDFARLGVDVHLLQ